MSQVSIQELLEAGVHFGHQARRWNPKMNKYILTKRNNIHVIDLRATVTGFETAAKLATQVGSRKGKVLFVGTKKQAQTIVAEEAVRCGQYFVNRRWLGGQLTNYKTIKTRIAKLKELELAKEDGTYDRFSKKEALSMDRERIKLEGSLGGIKDMERTPDLMFVVDPKRERIAIAEANQLGIPVVAITDTNCDPESIDYPIPGNDDATRAIRLLVGRFADAVLAGGTGPKSVAETAVAEVLAEEAQAEEAAPADADATPAAVAEVAAETAEPVADTEKG